MCVQNKTKKRNNALSYLFRTHLVITISAVVSGRLGAMSRMEVFFNKMLIATKHTADNNFVFQLNSVLTHLVCNIVQTSQFHFFRPITEQPRCHW